MPRDENPIPREEWRTIVEHVPIVSVDLLIEHDGGVLLGKRTIDPANGEWFMPGGRVLKNETRMDAVHRVAGEELGHAVTIEECLGTVEHFWETAELPEVDSKHYVSTGYRCHLDTESLAIAGDSQHSDFQVFRPPYPDLHPYVEQYLDRL